MAADARQGASAQRSCPRNMGLLSSVNMAKVLIVDDNEDVLISMGLLLQCAGYAVRTAPNGSKGLDLYRQDPPDVLITDLAMPEMDGIEMMVKIREEFPRSRILAISGF